MYKQHHNCMYINIIYIILFDSTEIGPGEFTITLLFSVKSISNLYTVRICQNYSLSVSKDLELSLE